MCEYLCITEVNGCNHLSMPQSELMSGSMRLGIWSFTNGLCRNLQMKFDYFFVNLLSRNGRNYPEKGNEMHPDLTSFFGAMSYTRFTMTRWVKHICGRQAKCCYHPYCDQAKCHFPGQHEIQCLFKAIAKFRDFFRLVWTVLPCVSLLDIFKMTSGS